MDMNRRKFLTTFSKAFGLLAVAPVLPALALGSPKQSPPEVPKDKFIEGMQSVSRTIEKPKPARSKKMPKGAIPLMLINFEVEFEENVRTWHDFDKRRKQVSFGIGQTTFHLESYFDEKTAKVVAGHNMNKVRLFLDIDGACMEADCVVSTGRIHQTYDTDMIIQFDLVAVGEVYTRYSKRKSKPFYQSQAWMLPL